MKPLYEYVKESSGAPLRMRTPDRFMGDKLAGKELGKNLDKQIEDRQLELYEWMIADLTPKIKKKLGLTANIQVASGIDDFGKLFFDFVARDEDVWNWPWVEGYDLTDVNKSMTRALNAMGLEVHTDEDGHIDIYPIDDESAHFFEWMSKNVKFRGYKVEYERGWESLCISSTFQPTAWTNDEVNKLKKEAEDVAVQGFTQIKQALDRILK